MLAQTVHALATAGRFDDANAVARNIQGLDEMLRALIGLARGLSKRGRFDEVEALINETPLGFPENWPESAQAESDLVAALAEQGQAVRAVEQAKRIHPQYVASTLRTVALALAARHDFAAALEAAQAIAVEQGRDSVETEVLSRMADAGNGVEAAARAEGLASAGWKSIALARIAKPIADAGRRTDAAGLVKKARALAGDIAETPLKVVAFCELAETLSAMQDADAVRTTLADAFLAASAAGRDGVFQALFRGAGSMASLDKAVTLRAVTDEIVRVEQWWATPLPLSVTQ
jgi:tetratricopeptide (TPR) repeat protein